MKVDQFDIQEEKEALYRKLVRPRMMEELKERILEKFVVQKKYRDNSYTARQLAADLESNVRYISAVIRVQFHTNYTTLVNKYRVEEAMSFLSDQRYEHLNIEEIGDIVGFAHRQSFHTAFLKFVGMTPKAYRTECERRLPQKPPKKRKTKREKETKNNKS